MSEHSHRERDVTPPIHLTSTYAVSWEEVERLAAGEEGIPFYARYGNPTVRAVEESIRDLCVPDVAQREDYDAVLTGSGMAAASLVMMGLLGAGDEVVATDTIYGGTAKLLRETLPRFGISARFVHCDLSDAAAAITERTKLLFVESPANPVNRLVILQDAAALARKHSLISCIDATLGPPHLQHPLQHGFDLEMHSATKYLGGHSDLLAGVVVGRKALIGSLRAAHRTFGAVLDPHAAWLLGRGLLTLEVRVQRINETSQNIALWLEKHPAVARVHYLGLSSHPDHAAAGKQMRGYGGIVAFDLRENTPVAVERFTSRLRLIRHAPSLGGTESLVSYPPLASHAGWSDAQLAAAGITRGTVRLAIGLENLEDLKADLSTALH